MSKYQKYPEYKDSGVEWLGEIPKHWKVTFLKNICKKITDGSHYSPQTQEEGMPYVSVKDIGNNTINLKSCKKISKSDFDNLVKNGCKPMIGDILLTKDGTIGRAAVVNTSKPFVVLSSLGIVRLIDINYSRFVRYYFISKYNVDQMYSYIQGSALTRITINIISNLKIPFPPKEEQIQIAHFLDHEIAKIDTLIEKQQQLIELLKEKRQAVISHAVTKGLDPNVPMRDSGVEWLGKVPEHWEVCHIKRKLLSTEYGISDSTKEEGKFEILTMSNIQDGKIIFSRDRFIDSISTNLLLNKGDLLFNRTNSLDLVGKVGLFLGGKNISFASYCVRLRLINKCNSKYFNYLLNSNYVLASARASSFPSISQTNLNPTRYGFLFIPCPNLEEQKYIVQKLDKICNELSNVISKSELIINLLKERRTALISAAVTGKIDVRNWQQTNHNEKQQT